MIYNYPCLCDYMKEDYSKIAHVEEIFKTISTLSDDIFSDYDADLFTEIGYQYYFERYKRPLTTLYFHHCKNLDWTDDLAVKSFFQKIGKIAYSRYGKNWEDIYKAYFLTAYSPLENYDMTQVRTPNLTYDTDNDRKGKSTTTTGNTTKVVPFNSTTEIETGAVDGSVTTEELLADNHSDQTTTETGTDTLTRHGNIGVTTSQQMLQAELDLRKLDFVKAIFADIDKVFLRNFYPIDGFFPL